MHRAFTMLYHVWFYASWTDEVQDCLRREPSPQVSQNAHMLSGAMGYLLYLSSALVFGGFLFVWFFFFYIPSHTQWLLSEVSSDMVFVHSSHLCLAHIVLPWVKSGAPHTFWTFRLQNPILSRREMLHPGLLAEAGIPSCVILSGLTRVCSLHLALLVFLYLPAVSEPGTTSPWETPPPPMWTPAARSHLLCIPAHAGTAAILSHWCWIERNHNLAGTKTERSQSHRGSVAVSLLCCGLAFTFVKG